MKQINYFGYYGYRNTGDDSFIESLSWITNNLLNSDISYFNVKSVPIIQTSTVKFNTIPDFVGASAFYKFLSLINSDTIIFGGGSTFHEDISFSNEKNLARIKKNIFKSHKLGALGISLGPFKKVETELKYISLLQSFDFLTLRDIDSYNLALSYDLPFKPIKSFDLAALLPRIYNESMPLNKFQPLVLGVVLCNYESYIYNGNIDVEKYRNDFLKNLIINISRKMGNSIQINFYVFNGDASLGDNHLTDYFINELNTKGVLNIKKYNYNPNVKAVWDSIRNCSLVISTRLHGSIFSYFNNIPFFLVEYHFKCTAFLDTIEYPFMQRLNVNLDTIDYQSNLICDILLNKDLYQPPKDPNFFTELTLESFNSISL